MARRLEGRSGAHPRHLPRRDGGGGTMTPPRRQATPRETVAAAKARASALQHALDRLADRRAGTSTVTVKLSAQGVLMPEVMIAQAIRAFTEIVKAAKP